MKSIPYIEYTEIEDSDSSQWFYMSHLSDACASMDPHRTSAYAICLLNKGEIQVESNLFVQKTQAPAIFTIAPSAIRKFTELETSYDARIFFFRREVFLEGQADVNYLHKFEFFEKTGQQVVELDSNQYRKFKSYFDLVHEKFLDTAPHTSDIVRSLIYIILNEIDNVYQSRYPDPSPTVDKGSHILSEFKALLADHFIEERKVAFYANKMHLTPKYFSTVIKEVSGKTAGTWINEMLLLEARVRLQNKDQSIAQIAYDLHFSDPSHFGKFFKKHTRMSPLEYRS